jgi:2-oxoglutarate dehydrogenase E1 component
MEGSLTVPTATSVRAVPAKLMIDNRIVINNHMKRARGGKVSFTHLIAFAMIKALRQMPEMNAFFGEIEGKPAIGHPEHINLGIAIDLAKADGSRQLLVPSIKGCENLDFAQFWSAYEAVVGKARSGTLTVEDFAGTTVSLTNPGTLGTVHSVPRLVQGQGLIIGVGALDYPAEFAGASEETLARMAISKIVTLTSTFKGHNQEISFVAFTNYFLVQRISTTKSLQHFVFLTNQFVGHKISNSQKMKRSIKLLVFNN